MEIDGIPAGRLRNESGEALLRTWRNAAEILIKQPDHQAAREKQSEIEAEWNRRCAEYEWPDEWLPWPRVSTSIVVSEIDQKPMPDDGMLKAMGYHVGQT
jgi:hypothetical protein